MGRLLKFVPLHATVAVVLALGACADDGSSDVAVDSAGVTTTTVSVSDSTSTVSVATTPDTVADRPDDIVRISVTVGFDSDPDRVEEVGLGQQVELTLTNPEEDDEFHLHGFDLGGDETPAGEDEVFSFTATEAGDFEVESHATGDVLVVIRVS